LRVCFARDDAGQVSDDLIAALPEAEIHDAS
jgi:hypothetical protein